MSARVPHIQPRHFKKPYQVAVVVAAILLCLGGCDSCLGRKPAPATPGVQSPATPLSPPRVQTPESPAALPALPPEEGEGEVLPEEDEASGPPSEYSADLLLGIKPGMSYEEVQRILGDPGVVVAGTEEKNLVYRWSQSGMSFMGRFENGQLLRKSIVANEPLENAVDEETRQFDQELFDTIQPGMNFDDVLMLIGMDAQPLTSGSSGVRIYKWTDATGSSITARFENQVLTRKSGTIITAKPEQLRETDQDEGVETIETVETDEQPPVQDTGKAGADGMLPMPAAEEEEYPEEVQPDVPQEGAQKPRVHVVGAKRREREIAGDDSPNAGRSYRPKTKLPEYKRSLRTGSYEIRVQNTTKSRAHVAIISNEGGLEMTVAPNGSASARVGRGMYQFYFIYDDDPHTLHHGQRIPVEELLMDFVVYLFDDSSEVSLM